jgi:hypothetical protein
LVLGALPGNSSVTPTGALTYSIPLDVPKGIGVTPDLSLVYSSSAGIDGMLGRGWGLLGAISEITVCDKTIDTEGVRRGVRFDGTDSYCLDGAKLVAVPNSSPLEFRTEHDEVVRVVTSGAVADGGAAEPWQSLTVYLNGGRIRTYAAAFRQSWNSDTDDTNNPNQSKTVIPVWRMTQEADRNGNIATFN